MAFLQDVDDVQKMEIEKGMRPRSNGFRRLVIKVRQGSESPKNILDQTF